MSADGHVDIAGYYGAVIAASLTMSLTPNRASTLKKLSGIDNITGYDTLSETNLNDLAVNGITVFAKDDDGTIYIRHTLTTGDFETINEREEMSTRNFDSISNYYNAVLLKLRGNLTATAEGLTAVYDALQKASDELLRRYKDNGISGQLVSYEIKDVSLDKVFQDAINVHAELELPHMTNRIELYLTAVSTTSATGTVLSAPATTVATLI